MLRSTCHRRPILRLLVLHPSSSLPSSPLPPLPPLPSDCICSLRFLSLFLLFRNDFSMEGYNEGEEKKGQQDEEEAEEREEEEERFWSSCSNGRLNRRHSREMMDEGSNPSPPLGWHLSWYERHHQGDLPHSTTHRSVGQSVSRSSIVTNIIRVPE